MTNSPWDGDKSQLSSPDIRLLQIVIVITWRIPKVLVWTFWASVMVNKEETAEDVRRREPVLLTEVCPRDIRDYLKSMYISCRSNQSLATEDTFPRLQQLLTLLLDLWLN